MPRSVGRDLVWFFQKLLSKASPYATVRLADGTIESSRFKSVRNLLPLSSVSFLLVFFVFFLLFFGVSEPTSALLVVRDPSSFVWRAGGSMASSKWRSRACVLDHPHQEHTRTETRHSRCSSSSSAPSRGTTSRRPPPLRGRPRFRKQLPNDGSDSRRGRDRDVGEKITSDYYIYWWFVWKLCWIWPRYLFTKVG